MNSNGPEFPWNYFANPTGFDAEYAANWIFLHLRAKAYERFQETGRGVLVGPYVADENGVAITSHQAMARRFAGQPVEISVMYLPRRSDGFPRSIENESVRLSVLRAIEEYDPETQCVVVLLHDNMAALARIVGVSAGPTGSDAPHMAWCN